ncbi:MAG TPA: response regulator [Pyrinomonadaceae bacterium]|jgi:two-component system cell cycle response regulator DivK|nr:response regulator [Pyrinomonadaceae bacterium]
MDDVQPGNRTVLVVDDSSDIRELMRMILQMKNCLVIEAVNGQEAVELAPQVHPNLILMDLSMPVLDGYEATRLLKAQDITQNIPIVAVSAFCDMENQHKAVAAGCVECVSKPIDFTAIGEVVNRYLQAG